MVKFNQSFVEVSNWNEMVKRDYVSLPRGATKGHSGLYPVTGMVMEVGLEINNGDGWKSTNEYHFIHCGSLPHVERRKVCTISLDPVVEKKPDNRAWPAIRGEEKMKEYKGLYTVIDGKAEFAYGWRRCLAWITEEYDIKPKQSEPTKEIESPPDFEAMSQTYRERYNHIDINAIEAYKAGAERIWKEHYLPMKEERDRFKEGYQLAKKVCELRESELNSLKEENERLKENPQ